MTQPSPPNPEELILAMLREVLARQAEAMGLKSETKGKPAPAPETKAPPPAQHPAAPVEPAVTREEVRERLRSQSAYEPVIRPEGPAEPITPPPSAPKLAATPRVETVKPPERAEGEEPLTEREKAELAEYDALAAEPLMPGGFTRAVRWSIIAILIVILLASLPVVEGQSLFRIQSEVQLVLRDGLLLKGSSDAVYVIEGGARRLISSAEAFEHYGYRWSAVTEVDNAYLTQIPEGRPINVLLTCEGLQDIYLLIGPEKRIVRDREALKTEGYTLERDLRTLPCNRLRSISDGLAYP
jgi:hypothetical protein